MWAVGLLGSFSPVLGPGLRCGEGGREGSEGSDSLEKSTGLSSYG